MKARSTAGRTFFRRVRKGLRSLKFALQTACRDISDILRIPVMLGLFALYVTVLLPSELIWSFFVAHNALLALALVTITSSPVIYGVIKRVRHESKYSSIPKEGWEGVPLEKIPEAVEEYKKVLNKHKKEND